MAQAAAEPNIFRSALANTAGDTALWTPTTGKRFRLMRLFVMVPTNCTLAARGIESIKLRDGITDLNISFDVWLGQTAPVEAAGTPPYPAFTSGWIDLGNGVLSAAVNNVLNINLSPALASGNIRVTACGTEE
jgi:hypothetical protein